MDRHPILTRALVLGEETRKVINKRGWESKATVNVSTRRFTEALASTAYMGGLSQTYVHGQTCVEPDEVILDLDFAGAYPAAMAVPPVIDWTEPAAVVQDPAEIAATYRQRVCGDQERICGDQNGVVPITCIECTFAFPPDCLYPGLPVPTQYGLVYPLRGETVCTGLEVALALAMGAQVTIKNGMRFPSFQDATGLLPLAFAGFLGELTRRRAQAPEDSLSNRLLKEMVNSFYGKLAQGITERQVYDFSGVSKPLQPSSITVPHYAAMTTGIGRAALAAPVAEIGAYPGCRILSATIDGAMSLSPGGLPWKWTQRERLYRQCPLLCSIRTFTRYWCRGTRLQGEWSRVERFSIKPGEVGLTTLEEADDRIDQDAKGRLAQLATGLSQR